MCGSISSRIAVQVSLGKKAKTYFKNNEPKKG
jgi:hypothetical protein